MSRSVWVIVAVALCGCARNSKVAVDDPLADMSNPRLGESHRIKAIDRAWEQAQSGTIDRITVRDGLKTVAWSSSWPLEMRMEALRLLTSDMTEKGRQDTHENIVKLMLPREPDRGVTQFLAEQAATNGWADTTPALIRSLSRPWPGVSDPQRPEYKALGQLNSGRTVQQIVYAVFLDPPQEGGVFGFVPAEKVRSDAWDLLARIDPDGSARAALIVDADASKPGPIADMQASLREVRCLPLTGDELRWLAGLRDFRDPANREWWDQAAAAVASLDVGRTGKLQLRHIESIRWAAANRPQWLAATRQELLSEVGRLLAGRHMHRRRAGDYEHWRPAPERLADWEGRLSWGDCLTLMVVDEAVHQPAVVRALFAQAEMDREDKTAEYGGLLRVDGAGQDAPPALVVMYPPRPAARRGDREFVASSDMINQGAHALAHYHFHAQELRNGEFAGPSADDLAYAARYGRACIVLTTIAEGVMDADYYQPDGVVLDLGELRSQ